MNKYKQYEFCKAIGCLGFNGSECRAIGCFRSAKDFHTWLDKNGYNIKREKEKTMTNIEYFERKLQVLLNAKTVNMDDCDIEIERLRSKIIAEKHTREEDKAKILNIICNTGYATKMSIADWKELVEDLVANGVTIDE